MHLSGLISIIFGADGFRPLFSTVFLWANNPEPRVRASVVDGLRIDARGARGLCKIDFRRWYEGSSQNRDTFSRIYSCGMEYSASVFPPLPTLYLCADTVYCNDRFVQLAASQRQEIIIRFLRLLLLVTPLSN